MTDQEIDGDEPAWKVGLADRLAQYVIWQTLFAQDLDDLDDLDTYEVWEAVIDHLGEALEKIEARWADTNVFKPRI